MSTSTLEKRSRMGELASKARGILEKSKHEKRNPTEEENSTFDRMMDDVDKLREEVEREERSEDWQQYLESPVPRVGSPADAQRRGREHGRVDERGRQVDQARDDFRQYLLTGEVRGGFKAEQGRTAEFRDTVISTDTKGGYLIAPVSVSNDIVKAIDDECFMRELATVKTVKDAKKLGVRRRSARMADANWTTEVQAVTEDTTMAFDRRDLEPYLLSKLARVSIRTLTLASDAETEVTDELSYKFGVTEEKAYLTGDGNNKPLGVFVPSANGISTARDVVCAGATTVAGDDFINAVYSIKRGYLASESAGWIMHRDAVKQARKLKNTVTGDYIWQPGIQRDKPETILDLPIYMSEFAPNTFAANAYVAVVGDFGYYRIAEVAALYIQRLVELYAATNEVGFIGRRWVDGAPMLEEAFARVKLAAS